MIGANTHSLKAVEVINPPKREMRRMEADAEERIAAALDKWRRDITRGMTADNAAFIVSRIRQRDVYQPFYDSIIAVLRDIALEGAGFGRRQIETAVLGISKGIFDIDWELANMAAERWARRFGAQLIRGVTDTTRQRVADTVADWTTNNESIGQLAKRLAEPGGPFGLTRARTIAVTETTRAYAEGNMAAWKESKVIQRRRWNTNVDEVVCPTCGPLHNVVAGLNEEFRAGNIVMSEPPAHPNCRCWITPVVEGAEERETGLGQFGLGPVGQPIEPVRPPWVPAQSVGEVYERMFRVADEYDLPDLTLAQHNSILKAAEEVLGSRGITVNSIGYQQKKAAAYGRATWAGDTFKVEIQKTFLKNAAKKQHEQIALFAQNKAQNIERLIKNINDPARWRLVEQNTTQLKRWEAAQRYAIFSDADDPLDAVVRHEFYHIVDFKRRAELGVGYSQDLATALNEINNTVPWAAVSEYGASAITELFPELATAYDIGVDIPDIFIQALRMVLK
jgi:SPP1 gp7 family putative phage head morphogenesis protein